MQGTKITINKIKAVHSPGLKSILKSTENQLYTKPKSKINGKSRKCSVEYEGSGHLAPCRVHLECGKQLYELMENISHAKQIKERQFLVGATNFKDNRLWAQKKMGTIHVSYSPTWLGDDEE